MGKFHGVLQGDDVNGLGVVDLVQDGGQGGGFPASRGPGYQDDPVLFLRHLVEGPGEIQILTGGNPGLQLTKDDGVISSLGEDVDAETGLAGQFVGRVAGAFGNEGFREAAVLIDQVHGEYFRLEGRQFIKGRIEFHPGQLSGSLDLKRLAHSDVQIRYIAVGVEHFS